MDQSGKRLKPNKYNCLQVFKKTQILACILPMVTDWVKTFESLYAVAWSRRDERLALLWSGGWHQLLVLALGGYTIVRPHHHGSSLAFNFSPLVWMVPNSRQMILSSDLAKIEARAWQIAERAGVVHNSWQRIPACPFSTPKDCWAALNPADHF